MGVGEQRELEGDVIIKSKGISFYKLECVVNTRHSTSNNASVVLLG